MAKYKVKEQEIKDFIEAEQTRKRTFCSNGSGSKALKYDYYNNFFVYSNNKMILHTQNCSQAVQIYNEI